MSAARQILRIATLLVLAGAVGCAGRQLRDCWGMAAGAPEIIDCEPTERRSVIPDVTAIPPLDEFTEHPKPRYCLLREHDAMCLAARNARAANLLEKESYAVEEQVRHANARESVELTRALLVQLAQHDRNRTAGQALELFLRLAEAEGAAENVTRRVQITDSILSDIDALRQQGIVPPVSRSEVARGRLELLHEQVELRVTAQQLHDQLVEQLDVVLADGLRFWPEADLVVHAERPDVPSAVATAMARRADLAALRLVMGAGDTALLDVSRTFLSEQHPALGRTDNQARIGWLFRHAVAGEANVRRWQLAELLGDQEQSVARAVTRAAELVGERLEQIALTQQRVTLAREHVENVRQQQQVRGGQLPIRQAELELLAAELDLLHDVIEWKIAQVRLQQAQGQLPAMCGLAGCPYCGAGVGSY